MPWEFISKEWGLARSDHFLEGASFVVRISRMLARECQAANEEPVEAVKVKPSNSALCGVKRFARESYSRGG